MRNKVKLNLGCAGRLLGGYINIDLDSLEEIKRRYPEISIPTTNAPTFAQEDALNLPFEDSSVDEIRADALLEHFSFKEESRFFNEAQRLLKPGGSLIF